MSQFSAPVLIRPAKLADAEAIACIRVHAWQAAYRDYMPAQYLASLDPKGNLDALRLALQSATPALFVKLAQLGGNTVAFSIMGEPRDYAALDTLELWALNVDPQHWRKGVAKALVNECLNDAKNRAASKLQLWCIAENKAARRLYESCGFIATSQQRSTSVLTGYPLHEVEYIYAL